MGFSIKCPYNVRTTRSYGAVQHFRATVQVFGYIFKNNIIGLDLWFSDSRPVWQYLDLKDSL